MFLKIIRDVCTSSLASSSSAVEFMMVGMYDHHLLDCPLPHLFQYCHGMCEKAQDENVPAFSCMCE